MTHATAARVVLDAGGRAPLLPEARTAFLEALDQGWADPRRLHAEGRRARMLLDGAREAIAAAVGARTQEVDLAPSHTAALHAAVRSVARGRRRTGSQRRRQRRRARGGAATRRTSPGTASTVGVDRHGRVDAQRVLAAARPPGRRARRAPARERRGGHAAARRSRARRRARGRRAAAGGRRARASATWTSATPGTCSPPTRATGADRAGSACSCRASGVRRSPDWPEDEDRWFPGGVSVPAAFAAAVALQVGGADAGAGRRRDARSSTACAARRGRDPRRRRGGRPGRPAPPRR